MNSRIDPLLCLDDGNRTVHVTGPFADWEPDEVGAVVAVIITQMKKNARVAVATGTSAHYLKANNPTGWTAEATVANGHQPLEIGPATAYATATIENDDGTFEPYNWTVQIRLVRCDDEGQPIQGDDN